MWQRGINIFDNWTAAQAAACACPSRSSSSIFRRVFHYDHYFLYWYVDIHQKRIQQKPHPSIWNVPRRLATLFHMYKALRHPELNICQQTHTQNKAGKKETHRHIPNWTTRNRLNCVSRKKSREINRRTQQEFSTTKWVNKGKLGGFK